MTNRQKLSKLLALQKWQRRKDNGTKFHSIWKFANAKRVRKLKENYHPKKIRRGVDTGWRIVKVNGKWEAIKVEDGGRKATPKE